jgi:hypothetical protein
MFRFAMRNSTSHTINIKDYRKSWIILAVQSDVTMTVDKK